MQEKSSFGTAYREFWKRSFDYKGTTSLRDYWMPVGFHMGLLLLALEILVARDKGAPTIPFWIIIAFSFISLIPFVALTVRRLRDSGLSGVWALLLLLVGAGTCIVLTLCALSSGFAPGENLLPDLYGPPPIESTQEVTEASTRRETEPETESNTETGPEILPSENIAVPLYGPPPTEPTQNE